MGPLKLFQHWGKVPPLLLHGQSIVLHKNLKMDEGSILIVDDDYLDIMALKRAFKKLNMHQPLHVAHNGKDALDKLRGEGQPKIEPFPSSIYLDMNMPKMSGIDFYGKIASEKNSAPMIPLMVLTGRGNMKGFFESLRDTTQQP